MLDEELLAVWLQLTTIINNQRLARGLSYNEAQVCGLLAGGCRTASELCAETRILKSQMTAIIHALEAKGVIRRRHSQRDRRRIELELLPEGAALYLDGHRRTLALVDRVIDAMGEEKVRALLPLLRQATEVFDSIQQEA